MYKLDDHLAPWIEEFQKFETDFKPKATDYEGTAFKILYEAAVELYLSILQPSTTRTVKAILTRSLIECYSDVFSIFKNDDPAKQAKKYVKYAEKLNRLFERQANEYVSARDRGEVTTRGFELARKYQACWNGMDVTTRVNNIDGGRHVMGYYEFFSLFAHVNPSRQLYLKHFDDPVIARYHGYIMLITLQALISHDFVPDRYLESFLKIINDYSADYIRTDTAPKYPNTPEMPQR